MIKKENIEQLLKLMKFKSSKSNACIYIKKYENNDSISVNLDKKEIEWPKDLKVNDKTTSNFEHAENFVVLECVNRLLSKGYLAKNMELEPRWQLGRGASGGKADILVKDNEGHEYLIIECKTYGTEYNNAWNDTLTDGAQLFSYAQQIKRTKYLCLYTSDIENDALIYNNKIITIQDNEEYLKTLNPNKRKRFKEANDVKELYNVWKEIYNLEAEETGIFEEAISPYEINKIYSLKDLKTISYEDTKKKYNEFATILRQHNVSGHENAFDKLVNVFLAKIVDEIQHPNSLKFNWKGIAYDDYYQLQDRLQILYKDGMQKFLNEEVTYIDNEQINDAFSFFKNDPDATKETVLEYFRQLKFYTNNDFSFIDVHNEELFKQNSEILLKIIKMFQDVRLKTEEQNQFLGDLFEGFLDDGVKQSEGQYFTPLPITRFIVSSLPLENIVKSSDEPPRVIDYACGAGHFLNEYARQIKKYIDETQVHDYFSAIDGIEKEYRLSKVSKVSAFMYGQDDINIFYGDALANNKNIKNNNYNILIANPPYAVSGFLETLTDEEREKFELIKLINKNTYSSNKSIETFFVERAKQLLKAGGVAGIILPASILTNINDAVFKKAREIILMYFDIIGIVELPSGTFGKTGKDTVIVFLRRKKDAPSLAEHYKNRVNSWFNGDFEKDGIFEDKEILLDYLNNQDIEYKDYIKFIKGKITKNLKQNNVFKQYLKDKKIKNLNDIKEIEKDKLYFYMLAHSQQNEVVVVTVPSKDKKQFLGYEWVTRRTKEGIKYVGQNQDEDDVLSKNEGIKMIDTPLFNPNDLYDENKINTIIRNNFNNIKTDIEIENVKYYELTELFNFSKSTFDKAFNLNNVVELKSKYPMLQIDEILEDTTEIKNINVRVPNENVNPSGKIPVITQTQGSLINGYTDRYKPIKELPLLLFGDHTCCFKYIDFEFCRGADGTQVLLTDESKVRLKYLYYISYIIEIRNEEKYERHFKYLKETRIPIPPIEIQDKIIDECLRIENKYKRIRISDDEYKNKIKQIFISSGVISVE